MREDFPTSDDFVAYLRGHLTPEEQALFEARVAGDERLRVELDRTRTVLQIVDAAGEETIVRRTGGWLDQAIEANASDLHLDLVSSGGVARLRIDGVLHEIDRLPAETARAAMGRLKQLLDCAPGDFIHPSDGRFRLERPGVALEVRGSYLPGVDGGRICLRFLDRNQAIAPWEAIFTRPANDAAARRLMTRPCGLVLVAGPTGSGKTTVAYRMLAEVAREQVNVLTIENPVEYNLDWISQTSVQPWHGLDHAAMLRSVMRQDPDVIFSSEVPDGATARLLVDAASTGHLVLCNLAANDCLSAAARFRDLGVEPFLIGATLVGLISTRIVRRVCPDCVAQVPPRSASAMMALGLDGKLDTVAVGQGCEACRGTGYRRRIALMELVEVNQALSDAFGRDAPRDVLEELAFTKELPNFRGQAAELVSAGLTTPEEACRVLFATW